MFRPTAFKQTVYFRHVCNLIPLPLSEVSLPLFTLARTAPTIFTIKQNFTITKPPSSNLGRMQMI